MKLELRKVVENKIMDPILITGPSGIGKTDVVNQIFDEQPERQPVYTVAWGQLAPVDARGVPVPIHTSKTTEFYSPSFWPKKGPGCLFLDEFNMASPTMMGIGQQLIRDRRFGDYLIPEGIHVWLAGNRNTHGAAVHEIPGPTRNRLAHYEVEPDLESFELFAFAAEIDPRIIGFLRFMTDLLHKYDPDSEALAWPSPRTWEMANRRLAANMDVAPVVGDDAAVLLNAHIALIGKQPHMKLIHEGRGSGINFPDEPSMKHAVVANLEVASLSDIEKFQNCTKWMIAKAGADEPEWVQMFVTDTMKKASSSKNRTIPGKYYKVLESLPEVGRFIKQFPESVS